MTIVWTSIYHRFSAVPAYLPVRWIWRLCFVILALTCSAQAQTFDLQPGKKIVLNEQAFEQGKATMNPQTLSQLLDLSRFLQSVPALNIEIGGHTDNQGSANVNNALSLARAEAVRQYLMLAGVAPTRIKVRGYSSTMPIASNETETGRSQNRRVEIVGLSNASERLLTANATNTPLPPDATLTFVQNQVTTLAPWETDWTTARVNQPIYEHHKINTTKDARAEVTFKDRSVLRVAENSMVVIYKSRQYATTATREHIGLVKGNLWLKLQALKQDEQNQKTLVRTNAGEVSFEKAGKISTDERGKSIISVHEGSAQIKPVLVNEVLEQPTVVPENFGTRIAPNTAPEIPRPLPPAPVFEDFKPQIRQGTAQFQWKKTAYQTHVELVDARSQKILQQATTTEKTLTFELPIGLYLLRATNLDSLGLESKETVMPFEALERVKKPFHWIEFFLILTGVGLAWYGWLVNNVALRYGGFALVLAGIALFFILQSLGF